MGVQSSKCAVDARECFTDTRGRAFFTSSKLSELETQFYYPPGLLSEAPERSKSNLPLLIIPAPTYSAPLDPRVLLPLLSSLSTPSPFPISVLLPANVPSPTSTQGEGIRGGGAGQVGVRQETIHLPFEPIGLLLYHRESHYESGVTPLVNWIPCKVEAGREECEGVARFGHLILEWGQSATSQAESGPPRLSIDEMEEQTTFEGGQSDAAQVEGTPGDFTTMRG